MLLTWEKRYKTWLLTWEQRCDMGTHLRADVWYGYLLEIIWLSIWYYAVNLSPSNKYYQYSTTPTWLQSKELVYEKWWFESNQVKFNVLNKYQNKVGLQDGRSSKYHKFLAINVINTCHYRYVREWLGVMTTAHIVDLDVTSSTEKYELPAHRLDSLRPGTHLGQSMDCSIGIPIYSGAFYDMLEILKKDGPRGTWNSFLLMIQMHFSCNHK